MRKLYALLAVLVLLVSSTAFAADGDTYSGATVNKGPWRIYASAYLCDTKAATEECAEWDFNSGPGMPEVLIIEEIATGSCTGTPTLTFTTGPVSGGSPAFDISTSTVTLGGATDRLVLLPRMQP